MGANEGNYSRDMFDESKQYVGILQQADVPVVDADVNDADSIYRTLVRRCYQDTVGEGSSNNGFKIIQATSTANNFKIQGGGGTVDTAGVLVREGLRGIIPDTGIDYVSTDKRLQPQVTGIAALVLTDTAANYVVNELAGRILTPDVDIPGVTFTVASNTATAITVTAGDMTAATSAKKFYRVELSTPGGARTDTVWAHFFIDEWNSDEDTNLVHSLGSSVTAALRNKLRTVIHVYEGSGVWSPSDFTDTDGRSHYVIELATLARLSADPTVVTAMITDERSTLLSMAAINAELIQSRTADSRRTDGAGPNYASLDDRLDSMDDEICDARGSASFLTTRLDIALTAAGEIKASYITSAMILDDEIVDADINSAAAIAQTKVAASASVNDAFVGATTTLEDDLNEIRTVINILLGATNWDDTPTQDLETLNTEVTNARGSLGDLDSRLDVSLNEDGTIKSASLSIPLQRFAAEPALMFYPKDGSWTNTYRLHQYRGFMKHNVLAGNANTIYVDYNLSHSDYPIDVVMGAAAGPGGADNDAASQTVGLFWYYVYLIGKADGSLSMVYSTSARAPWGTGPLLDNSTYDFPTNGWIYWKFIGAVRNGNAGSWEIVPMRKKGNHVQYEQAQEVLSGSGLGAGAIVQFSLLPRIPETSMRGNVGMQTVGLADGEVEFHVRPASVLSGSETMMLQDPGAPLPVSALSIWGVPKTGTGWKLVSDTQYAGAGEGNGDSVAGWTGTDDFQRIDYRVDTTGSNDREWYLYVLGYEEFTDVGSGEFSF